MTKPTESCPAARSPDVPAGFLEGLNPEQRAQFLARHPVQQRYLVVAALENAARQQAKTGTIPAETLIGVMTQYLQGQAALIEWGRTQAGFMADPRMQSAYQYWDGAGRQDPQFRRLMCEAVVALEPEASTDGGAIPDQPWGQLIVVNFGGAKGGEA